MIKFLDSFNSFLLRSTALAWTGIPYSSSKHVDPPKSSKLNKRSGWRPLHGNPSLAGTCERQLANPLGPAPTLSPPPQRRIATGFMVHSSETKHYNTSTGDKRNCSNPQGFRGRKVFDMLILPYGRFAMSCCTRYRCRTLMYAMR